MVPSVTLQRITSDGYNPGGSSSSSSGYNGNVINSYMQGNSNLGVDSGTQLQLNSILRSVLKQENIDYENDFYWMDMLQKEKVRESMILQGQGQGQQVSGGLGGGVGSGSGRLSPPRNFPYLSQHRSPMHERSRSMRSQQSRSQSQSHSQPGDGSLGQPLLQGQINSNSNPNRGISPMGSLLGVFGSQLNVIWEGAADRTDDSVPLDSSASGTAHPHQLPFGGSRYHYGGGAGSGPRSGTGTGSRGMSPAPLPPRTSSLMSPQRSHRNQQHQNQRGAQSTSQSRNTQNTQNPQETNEYTALLDNEEEEEGIASV